MSRSNAKIKNDEIVIDPKKGLIFSNEKELFDYFKTDIDRLEEEYLKLRSGSDFNENQAAKLEQNLSDTLESPDEIWLDKKTLSGKQLHIYIREFEADNEDDNYFHVAVCYMTESIPSFVYLHFPSKHLSLIEQYQRGEIIYDRALDEAPLGAIEGDALLEGDELATGLYKAMLMVRSEDDIPESQFRDYAKYRETAIEEAEEIWRNTDTFGNVLVHFIKEFHEEEDKSVFYIVSTIEDTPSNSHALLFSFPTTDQQLVTRYRHGENLQADEVVQEASH